MPKVLLHNIAAQKYATFLAESTSRSSHSQPRPGANGHGNLNLPPLSYYRRPRRKRQASQARSSGASCFDAVGCATPRPRQRPVFGRRAGEGGGGGGRGEADITGALQASALQVFFISCKSKPAGFERRTVHWNSCYRPAHRPPALALATRSFTLIKYQASSAERPAPCSEGSWKVKVPLLCIIGAGQDCLLFAVCRYAFLGHGHMEIRASSIRIYVVAP